MHRIKKQEGIFHCTGQFFHKHWKSEKGKMFNNNSIIGKLNLLCDNL